MKPNYGFVVALWFSLALCTNAGARSLQYGDAPITLEIPYGKSTVLRFDSKVSSIQNAEKYEIGPLNDQQPNYAELSVKPRTTSGGDTVNFHLADGAIVKLRLLAVTNTHGEGVETVHTLKKVLPEPAAITKDLLPDPSDDEMGDGKVALMKALILGTKLRGYQIRPLGTPVKTALDGVEATLEQVYAGRDYTGYVIQIVNKDATRQFEIDIRRLKIGEPNLALMSQVDRRVIEREASGRNIAKLTIVALPSSLSRDVVLPLAWIKKEAK